MPNFRIKTFEEACEIKKIPTTLPQVNTLPEIYQKPMIAIYQLIVITDVLNEGWKPNWEDDSERKFYPYFYISAHNKEHKESNFEYLGYVCDYINVSVVPWLHFKSAELAEYASNQFIEIYKSAFLIP